MKIAFLLTSVLFVQVAFSQTQIVSKKLGTLTFKELDYGIAKVKNGTSDSLSGSPTGTHMWLEDFEIVKQTDSIKIFPKANFGTVYIFEAKDTFDIDVTIEWIYPRKVTNEKGESFKSIKYTTKRPTNIPSASSYSLDSQYEFVEGEWQLNLFIENKKVYTKKFILYQ
jgi:hypothetical protein